MNYIDIDLFGGIVSNADSEDIRPDIGQDIVNFTLDKAGTLKYNKKYITAASFDDLLVSGVIYWTDFTFNDHTPKDFYVLNISRARYRHNLKPGTLNLFLTSGSNG